jgi:N-acetylglucosaminyldiphosphoundecaprenol N-acetyl-beta-D-mannosaminyltransferase
MSKVDVLGVHVDALRLEEVLERLRQIITAEDRALVAHVNIMAINMAYEQPWFRDYLNEADLLFCDGMGVKLGARILGVDIPERFTLADWMWQFSGFAAQHDFSFYFLGNPAGVAQRAADRLLEKFPSLDVVGFHDGYFDKTKGCPENNAVLEEINALKVNVLFVGFGMPLQELWLKENWPKLDVNIAITCGAIFEYISGDLKRGPGWMTQNYLEWLSRVLISPNRYGKRYIRDIPKFAYRVLKQRLMK